MQLPVLHSSFFFFARIAIRRRLDANEIIDEPVVGQILDSFGNMNHGSSLLPFCRKMEDVRAILLDFCFHFGENERGR